MTNGSTTWNYTYSADGMRKSRTNGSSTYTYVYNGDQLTQMTKGNDTLYFTYGSTGPVSVTWNGTTYYYVVNAQGDVIGIMEHTGDLAVEYRYNAWGEVTYSGYEPELAQLTPLRYRGYVYDTETGLYYVSSRYYDPEIGRWISPEPNVFYGEFDEAAGLLGYNVYAYCANNPVMHKDENGESISLAMCVFIGFVVGAVVGGSVGAVISYSKYKAIAWQYIFIGAAAGAAIGAAAGYAIGIAIGASVTTAATAKGFSSTFKITAKISKQMNKRGWSEKLIKETILKNVGRKAVNKATGNAATAYFTSSGAYVVIDNITKEIIQISNIYDPNWVVDETIKLFARDVFIK